jgi:hypothetical protein
MQDLNNLVLIPFCLAREARACRGAPETRAASAIPSGAFPILSHTRK